MKSIKEKSNEYADEQVLRMAYNGSCDNCKQGFVLGANYVLEKFIDIVNKNTKPYGMEDRAKMAYDLLILIAQLKK